MEPNRKYFDEILAFAKENGNEGDKLDFKSYWYKNETKYKNELVKDLISLANGSINSIGELAVLLIGFNENKREILNIIITDPKGKIKGQNKLKDEITQTLKNYTNKPLNFDVSYHVVEEKQVVFITIKPHSYLIFLEKELETPGKTYSKGILLYRENGIVEVASHAITEEFQKAINDSDLEKYRNKELKIPSVSQEIKLEARDILSLIVSPKDIKHNLSVNKGIKLSKPFKIYYEYYVLDRRGYQEGYLFFGKYTSNKHTFQHFCKHFGDDLPKRLEIFLVKKRDGNRVTDKKSDIYKNAKEYIAFPSLLRYSNSSE